MMTNAHGSGSRRRASRRRGGGAPGAGSTVSKRYGPDRLGALYEISKLLTQFVVTVEQTVLALLAIINYELPIQSMVLLETTTELPKTIVWHLPGLSALQRREAEFRTIETLRSLTHPGSPAKPSPGVAVLPKGRFINCPLVVKGQPIMGLLHLEGVEAFAETDLGFLSAIANQLAIALDRYYVSLKWIAACELAEANRLKAEKEALRRRDVEEEVRRLNKDLERRVALRTAEFQDTIKELHSFTYSIAHDLRAPLRHIHGFSRLLLTSQDEEDVKRYADRIMNASASMDVLIKDLLDYGRLTLEKVVCAPVSLSEVVAKIRESLEDDLRNSQAELAVAEPLPRVFGQERMLTQAIANLVANALKFARPGVAARVQVSAETRGDSVRLWVQDNGIGIAPEHQERIFGIFQRLHKTEEYPGTGIGLAIVRRAMERMDGRAGVESEPGKGSRFWIEMKKAAEAP